MSGVFPFALCLYFLRQVLSALNLKLQLLLAWLANETLNSPVSAPPPPSQWQNCQLSDGGLDLGLHAFTINSSSTEPSIKTYKYLPVRRANVGPDVK